MSEPTIKVDLTVPDGLPEMSVTVACQPENQAEHDAGMTWGPPIETSSLPSWIGNLTEERV